MRPACSEMWVNDWIGLRYQELGRGPHYDCLGLYLALFRHRFGLSLPDPSCTMIEAVRRQVADGLRPQFRRVGAAKEGDALLFRIKGHLLHVGFALDRRDMLHIEHDTTGSLLEIWDRQPWRGRLEGIYRFERSDDV